MDDRAGAGRARTAPAPGGGHGDEPVDVAESAGEAVALRDHRAAALRERQVPRLAQHGRTGAAGGHDAQREPGAPSGSGADLVLRDRKYRRADDVRDRRASAERVRPTPLCCVGVKTSRFSVWSTGQGRPGSAGLALPGAHGSPRRSTARCLAVPDPPSTCRTAHQRPHAAPVPHAPDTQGPTLAGCAGHALDARSPAGPLAPWSRSRERHFVQGAVARGGPSRTPRADAEAVHKPLTWGFV